MLDERKEEAFCTILREELQLATGCTEPIAVAYCAARLRQVLGQRPCRILAEVSGNILKNVKSVVVPNTGGRRGLPAAIAVGMVAGDPEARLQVIAHVTEADAPAIGDYLDRTEIRIDCPPTPRMLDIRLTGWTGDGHRAVVHVANNHTNIIYVERDGEVLLEKPHSDSAEDNLQDKSVLNVRDILTFAETVDVSRIEDSVGRQIDCNTAIAREGLRGDWGANIGSTLLLSGGDVETQARAWAAAGSDARMNGCEMPVVICSGSGNQGITASVPVVVYAQELGVSRETLYRALAVSNLSTIHIKAHIGTLSAYCGAVSAGCGAGAGITYLYGGGYEQIKHTLVNAMAITSGIICDGAKPSCAAKIATSVDAGLLGYHMYRCGNQFYAGDGIVKSGIEHTIETVGALAHTGMADTDRQIIRLMMEP